MQYFESVRCQCDYVSVIILTGFGDVDSAKKAIRLDVTDFLTKPVMLGELKQSLERGRQKRLQTAAPILAPEDEIQDPLVDEDEDEDLDEIEPPGLKQAMSESDADAV